MRYALAVLVLFGVALTLSADPGAQTFPPLQPATGDTSVPSAPARDAGYSFNWAGYEADHGTYSSVWGRWIVPAVSPSTVGADATWVGIGGVNSNDLLQAGTQAIVDSDGTVDYEAWVEAMPGASKPLPVRVVPGDTVYVSVAQAGNGLWKVTLRNETSGKSYALTVPYSSSEESAEWIEEAPSTLQGRVLPLSDFGTVKFLGGGATKDGKDYSLADLDTDALNIVTRAGDLLTQTSVLGEDGGFGVVRTQVQDVAIRALHGRFRYR